MTRHAAGVGKIDRQSPVMNAKITEVNFNPFWTVPASIIRKDLIPKMQKEPNYLTDNKIRIFNGQGARAQPAPGQLALRRGHPLHVQAGSGRRRELDGLRAHQHPEPARRLHARHARRRASSATTSASSRRAACACRTCATTSSGSSRTRPAGTASRSKRPSSPASASTPGSRSRCNVYWTYITAWATADGLVQFRDDIYNRDGLGMGAVASRMQRPTARTMPKTC